MGGSVTVRAAVCAGVALATGALGVSLASAQQAADGPAAVNFSDPQHGASQGPALDLAVRQDPQARFTRVDSQQEEDGNGHRGGEVALTAGDGSLDISLAQRASFGTDANGDLNHHASGSEVRIGRNLVRSREINRSDTPSVYAFVANDDQALTWQPGARSEFGGSGSSVSLQDRVEVGDMSAGVTVERNGVQASLAYVERTERTRVGNRNFGQDQSFAGVTVTMRHR